MILYHVGDDAPAVLERGFQDGESFYRGGVLHRGVWLFDRPMEHDQEQEVDLRTVAVDIPDDVAARHEWLQEGSSYRTFLIPAEIANGYLRKE
jgi:hypothetical protein